MISTFLESVLAMLDTKEPPIQHHDIEAQLICTDTQPSLRITHTVEKSRNIHNWSSHLQLQLTSCVLHHPTPLTPTELAFNPLNHDIASFRGPH